MILLSNKPAKRLCDASSVLVGVELPISSRFQPSPLASKLLAASRKGEHCASVSPCQYIAYPQQVLCSAFSRRQVLLGTVRAQHWICKGEFVWPKVKQADEDNIPLPAVTWRPHGSTGWHNVISPLPRASVRTLQTPWRQLHNGHLASKGPKASQSGWLRGGGG